MSWEYAGHRSDFSLEGPPGLPVVALSLQLPTSSQQGTLYGVIRPRDMMIPISRLRVYIPAVVAPPLGVFHLAVLDTRWTLGLSLVSTVDDREVHATFVDESDFTVRMLHVLAAIT